MSIEYMVAYNGNNFYVINMVQYTFIFIGKLYFHLFIDTAINTKKKRALTEIYMMQRQTTLRVEQRGSTAYRDTRKFELRALS